jgi:RimJ/RimL family protein N-acetyltransferase
MVALPVPDPPLTDGVVVLRRFTFDDVPVVTRACRDPEIARWTAGIPEPYEEHHAREWIGLHDRFWGEQLVATLAFCDAASGELLGSMTLAGVDLDRQTAGVGYWAAPWARRRGATTRAARLACDWGFESLGLETLDLLTIVGNRASERVAEKAGFAFVGTIEDFKPERAVDPGARYVVKRWVRRRTGDSGPSSDPHFDNDCQKGVDSR